MCPLVSSNDAKWISNLDMLNSIIRAYGELESVLEERGEGDKIPRPLGFLRAVADFYQPFGAAVEALSASQAPTVHLVVPHFFRLKAHVHKPLSTEHGSFPEMNALLELQVQIRPKRKFVSLKDCPENFRNIQLFVTSKQTRRDSFPKWRKHAEITAVSVRPLKKPVLPSLFVISSGAGFQLHELEACVTEKKILSSLLAELPDVLIIPQYRENS